jgi:hypothetical protein
MIQRCLFVAIVLSSVLLLGCDGSKSRVSSDSNAAAMDFCKALGHGLAESAMRCMGGPLPFWDGIYAEFLNCGLMSRRIASGEMSYDSKLGATCLKQVSEFGCGYLSELPTCTSALVGHVPAGGSCSDPWQSFFNSCSPGAFCEVSYHACSGTCVAYARSGEACILTSPTGEVSQTVNLDCASGTSCQTYTKMCVPDIAEGQPCQGPTDGDCADGLYCPSNFNRDGICQKGRTSGSCDDSYECAFNYRCIGEAGAQSCQRMKLPGEPCTPGLQECFIGYSWCGSDGKCTYARVQEGQPCDKPTGEYNRCETGLYCAYDVTGAGICQKQRPAGSPCNNDGQCAGSNAYCDATTQLCVVCE